MGVQTPGQVPESLATVTPQQALQRGPGESWEEGFPGRPGEPQHSLGKGRWKTSEHPHWLPGAPKSTPPPPQPDTPLMDTREGKGGWWKWSEMLGLCLGTLMRATSASVTFRLSCHVF